ncbi:twin-arginine translocase subunit TatC [Salana multivorans]
MSLGQHLRELRNRVALAVGGILLGAIGGWIAYPYVFELLRQPIQAMQEAGIPADLNFQDVLAAFDTKVRISIFLGVLVTTPWWLYQVWAFLAPGLTGREKRYGVAFVGLGAPLFLGGAYVAWSVLPTALRILGGAIPDGVENLINGSNYITFVTQFLAIFGLAFLLPLLMVMLTAVGIVRARTWLKTWRWSIVGIFTFAAFATPAPDAVSMILMAVPLLVLYGGALGIALLIDRRRAKRLARAERAEAVERSGVDDDAGSGPTATPASAG